MSAIGEFTGLPLPVFTAFGWAGEEAAIQFALDHLKVFIDTLHANLSDEARLEFPIRGINQDAQLAYLGTGRDVEEGPYIAFTARPNFLELRLTITNRLVVHRGLRAAEKEPDRWYAQVKKLSDSWSMQIEQRLIEEESGIESHYGDLFKDAIARLDLEASKKAISRGVFLNGEDKWLIPMYFSFRINSIEASSMNSKLIPFIAAKIDEILPMLRMFTRKQGRASAIKGKSSGKVVRRVNGSRKGTGGRSKSAEAVSTPEIPKTFAYETEIKPLHLRKGFINLTTYHWEFFAQGPRTEIRPITVFYGDQTDKASTVWRLQPDNRARVVLSEPVHAWLQANFPPNSKISISATKLLSDEIEVKITQAEQA